MAAQFVLCVDCRGFRLFLFWGLTWVVQMHAVVVNRSSGLSISRIFHGL